MRISSVIRVRVKRLIIGLGSICIATLFFIHLTTYQDRFSIYSHFKRHVPKGLLHFQQNAGDKTPSNNKTVVILYTNQRSGSTFLGEIFNHNPKAFYIFEPLLPFTTSCQSLAHERVQLLTELSQCDFANIRNSYENAFRITRYPDSITQCLNNTICFLSNQQGRLLKAYANACNGKQDFVPNSTTCGLPLQSKYLNKICEDCDFTVFKVLRACSLASLETFYSYLKARGYQVFFIHLIRDPRAVMSSRLDIHLDGVNKQNIGQRSAFLCDRYSENLRCVENSSSGRSKNFIADHRYIRVRFEDVAFDSINVADRLYRFIGKEMPPEVRQWIENSQLNIVEMAKTAQEKAFELARLYSLGGEGKVELGDINLILSDNKDPYSTIRDPNEVLGKWRKSLSFEMVESIQENCKDAMKRMNYRLFSSRLDMLNLTLKYY